MQEQTAGEERWRMTAVIALKGSRQVALELTCVDQGISYRTGGSSRQSVRRRGDAWPMQNQSKTKTEEAKVVEARETVLSESLGSATGTKTVDMDPSCQDDQSERSIVFLSIDAVTVPFLNKY